MHRCLLISIYIFTVASVTVFANNVTDNLVKNFTNGKHKNPPKFVITGFVFDENNEPLPGASVIIKGSNTGIGTNSDGKFILPLKDDKDITIAVFFTGYLPYELFIRKGEDKKKQFNISLKPAKNQIDEIVVTGNYVERVLKDVPVVTRVINRRSIEQLSPPNIETLLQYELPGLQIGYNSMSKLPTFTYQGVSSKSFLFLIDGEKLSGEGASENVDLSRFNIDDIERVELVKGSQSTVYGSSAMGGVINIITKNATRPFNSNFSARYSPLGGQMYSFSAGTKQNKISALSSVSYRKRNTYTIGDSTGLVIRTIDKDGNETTKTYEKARVSIYGNRVWNINQKFTFSITEKLKMELTGSYYNNKLDVRDLQRYYNVFSDYAINTKVKYLPSDNHKLIFSYVLDNYKKDEHFFLMDSISTIYKNYVNTARINYYGKLKKHEITAGIEHDHEYLKHYMLKDSSDAKVGVFSFFAQDEWRLHQKIRLVGGLRWDYHKNYKLNFSPKLSLMYTPFKNYVTIRAGYSQGFRTPDLKELYEAYNMGGMNLFIIYGNKDLKPERSNQFTLSTETNIKGFNLTFSAYHNLFKDKIVFRYMRPGSQDIQYVNADKSMTSSFEAAIKWNMNKNLFLMSSYSYVYDYKEYKGKNTSYNRPHGIIFNAAYKFNIKKVSSTLSLRGQWVSAMSTYEFSKDDSYSLRTFGSRTLCALNLSVIFPRGVSFAFGIDNLFNYKDKAIDSIQQLPQRGRSYFASMNINLSDIFRL